MNKLMYIGLIIVLFSCKSNSIAQEKEKGNTEKPKIEKPKFGDQNDNQITKTSVTSNNQISPNTLHLKGIVLEIFENKSICGTLYEVTVRIKVKSVIGSGSGIVNMIESEQEVVFGLTKNQLSDLETLQQKTDVNQEINLVALEVLCQNMNETAYQIISFTSKN
ncbi:hypothetical protein [uncultured Aquimarina sp.]|uniref:hypothetical protein n=1 Tax=uncultured Aquimarina sp. TaxID=575652 RepID=UPI0026031678|nr:hypothetical protein [uncultured Aquimarina sp.]